MNPQAQLRAFAQSVNLVVRNRYFDEIEGEDGQRFVEQVIDWTNQLLDELENLTDQNGNIVHWNWTREIGADLGRVSRGATSLDLGSNILTVVPDEHRRLELLVGGKVKSRWAVVTPDQIANDGAFRHENYVTVSGQTLHFSRPINDSEHQASVRADIITSLPRLTPVNVRVLSIVKPKQLLVLGVAKNSSLPNVVQGPLSPSYVQKYNTLLQGAIARNAASSRGNIAYREDLGHVGGIY